MMDVGQISCGYWGPNLLRNLVSNHDCYVKWVVEISEDRQKYVQILYAAVKIANDLKDVLHDDEISAIVIATPAESHYSLTVVSIKAGKHVILEKPMAMKAEEV